MVSSDRAGTNRSYLQACATRRGGASLEPKAGEIKLEPDGTVKTTRGVSVNVDPAKVERFGGAYEIKNLPPELQIKQVGADPGHFEIVPREPGMKPERFRELLKMVEELLEGPKEP